MRLMTPPLPAASGPSKTRMTFRLLSRILRWKWEQIELQILYLLAVVGFIFDLLGEVEVAEQARHTIGKNVS